MATPSQVDWFAANAPKPAQTGDWFKDNAPQGSASVQSSAPGAQVGKEDSGFISKAWKALNTPVADLMGGDGATKRALLQAVGQHLGLDLSPENLEYQMHRTDTSHPAVQGLRTFLAGSLGDTADTVAGLTSPVSIGTAAIGTAAKGAGAAAKVAKVVAPLVGAGFAAKGVKDVAQNAGAALQGNPDAAQKALMGGAMMAGGAAGAVPESLNGVAADAAAKLEKSAVTQYQQALNPTKERTKFIAQKRTPEMLQRGITGDSPAAIADSARSAATGATKKLNDIYESLPADRTSPTAPMVQALQEYKAQFQDRIPITEQDVRNEYVKNKGKLPDNIVKGDDGTFSKVIDIDPNAVAAADKMKGIIAQYGDSINPNSMRKARQIFDESVARAGGYEGRSLEEGSLIDAKKEAATAIREQLAKDNPELDPLNKEVSFWLDVQKVAAETAKRRIGQQGGLTVQMAKRAGQVAGGGVGLYMGGPVGAALGTYAGGELLGNIARVTRSTKWRTVSAVEKYKLAQALADGNFGLANSRITFLGRQIGALGASGANGSADESQESGPSR